MFIRFEKVNDILIAHMTGELDHHSAEEVRIKIDDRLDDERISKIILDFRKVTFMDSSGIGVVIGRYKKLKNDNGKICIANAEGSVKRVFELSGMFKIIKCYDSIKDAVKNI